MPDKGRARVSNQYYYCNKFATTTSRVKLHKTPTTVRVNSAISGGRTHTQRAHIHISTIEKRGGDSEEAGHLVLEAHKEAVEGGHRRAGPLRSAGAEWRRT